ncbi:MAG: MmcQ/YjbR family DNA-binding protein [Sphingomonas sp.]
MADTLSSDPENALEQVRALALDLPEASEKLSHGQPTFFVAGKQFAQFRHDHHGDGRTIVAVKTADEEDLALIEAAPELYSRVAYFGRGWVGLAVGQPDTDWAHVGDRIARSWELAAPRRLLEAGGR